MRKKQVFHQPAGMLEIYKSSIRYGMIGLLDKSKGGLHAHIILLKLMPQINSILQQVKVYAVVFIIGT